MLIHTKFLGKVEIQEQAVIHFESGLPGFQELRGFVLLPVEEGPGLYYLQSVEEPPVCFITASPFLIMEDYEMDISEETVEALAIEKQEEVSLYVVLTIPEDIKDMTANLLAPIVINRVNNKAAQEILNHDKYHIKHKVFRGE
jgi:flagellar assembly factor FliW